MVRKQGDEFQQIGVRTLSLQSFLREEMLFNRPFVFRQVSSTHSIL